MKIKLYGSRKEFKFPDVEWQQLDTMPEDPPNSVAMGK